jgi:CBS domain-containing protein
VSGERRRDGVADLLELPGLCALPGVVGREALEDRGLCDRDADGVGAATLLIAAGRVTRVLLVPRRLNPRVARDGRRWALTPDEPLHQLIAYFSVEESDTLPIIDRHGRLLGVVDATDVEQAIEGERNGLTAAGLARPAPKVRADESLEEAVQALAGRDENGVPVLAETGEQVVGWLTHRRLLDAYRTRLNGGRAAALHGSSASAGVAT